MDDFYQLPCMILQGDSPFRIQWVFNNETLMQTETVKIEFAKRSSTLTFEAVNGDHVGNYTCLATNRAGTTMSTFELIVKGSNLFYSAHFMIWSFC